MRKLFAVIAVSVWLLPLALALPASEGESLVQEHCSSCHRPASHPEPQIGDPGGTFTGATCNGRSLAITP